MTEPVNQIERVDPTSPTVDSLPRSLAATPIESRSASAVELGLPVALVEGSGPALSGQTNALLHRRLFAAALMLFVGSGALFIKNAIELLIGGAIEPVPFGMHGTMVAVLGTMTVLLRRRREISLRRLRAAELVVFGAPLLFFAYHEYILTAECCAKGFFDFETRRWLVLMFVYALFIPNTWQRAAGVLGVIALTPIVLLAVLLATSYKLHERITMAEATEIPVVMFLVWLGSVYGVYTIGSLRREVFEARQLGQYRLKRRIGAGGMGEVYLAEHQMMKRPCVIKLIRPDKADDPRTLARFQREVRATAKLSHWNTIEIFDYGSTDEGVFYYVMEYLPGLSLADLVEQFGPVPPARTIHFLRQACDALSEAHAAGLIHRDIKP
ncbi:MAG: serine/threonine protein kinase, partial [Pirellulales bacterium]|nr:serine/threonine protein kinase [Pirellulales bacterium]